MQSGERYGVPPFTTAPSRSSHVGGGGAAENALSQLFGHQTGVDGSGLQSLHLHGSGGHRVASTEQQYMSGPQQQQLELNQQQQLQLAGDDTWSTDQRRLQVYSSVPPAGIHHHAHLPAGFFRTSTTISGAAAAAQQQQAASISLSGHSFFMCAAPHAAPAADSAPSHFKLLHMNQIVQGEDHDEQTVVLSSTWREDETAALIKICLEMDSLTSNTALWDVVARKLQDMGYQRSPRECLAKFESMPQNYGAVAEEDGAGEQEFSSDFSSEGGHAEGGHINENDDEAAEEANNIIDLQRPREITKELMKSKKRKQGFTSSSWAPSQLFFERLTREIMEKQESLHRSFLETLERKDRERAMRDEAYRRQEAARLDREQEIRAQEVSIAACRDAALIAFLEKATGQTLHEWTNTARPQLGATHVIPPRSSTSNGGASAGNDAAALILQSSDHHHHHHHLVPSQADLQDAVDMYNSDLNTKRWPKVEVHALIRLRSGMEPRFREAGPKAHLWQEISASMACLGFIRSPKRCKEKWENINKYFKKTKDSSKKRPENAKTCPYFHQLDTLYQRGILASSSTGAGTSKAVHGKSGDSQTQYNTQMDDSGLARPLVASENMQISDQPEESAEQQQGRSNEMCNDRDTRIMDGTTAQSSIFACAGGYNSNPNVGSDACAPSIQLPLSYRHHGHAGRPIDGAGVGLNILPSKKSIQLEMFVKDILDLQQRQQQKLVDEYDRMEQSHELREMERAQQMVKAAANVQVTTSAHHEGGSTHDNATLMALVHKLAGESADLSMSSVPSTGME